MKWKTNSRTSSGGNLASDVLSSTDALYRFDLLLEAFSVCWEKCWVPGELARYMHLFGYDLRHAGETQGGLFGPPAPQAAALATVKRPINERSGRGRGTMPATGWVNKEELQDGSWQLVESHAVMIPANAGCDNGIWYRIREGIEGLLVYDNQERPVVYLLVAPASHYFRTMTRSYRMPVLVGEVI
jgi:hypothetical protein